MSIQKVFISYSHDSQEHKLWVLDLATRLRNSGVDAILDQWDLRPGDDLPRFMENKLIDSDYVLMICTDRYVEKANAGAGGVGYEKMIVTSEVLSNIDSNKVIPIIRQKGTCTVPIFLRTKLFIDFSLNDDYEFNFDELVRTIHNAPVFKKPEIGNNPFKSKKEIRPDRSQDSLIELMKFLISDFEASDKNYTLYFDVVKGIRISRVYLDVVIEDAVKQELIRKDNEGDLYLTTKGKIYAIEHKLVTDY